MRRLRNSLRLPDDPFLKAGIIAMAFALSLVCVVAFAAFLDGPIVPAAAKSTAKLATEPLVRSDPAVDPWVEERVPLPRPEPQPAPEPEPQAEPEPTTTPPKPQPEPEPEPEPEPRPDPLLVEEAD